MIDLGGLLTHNSAAVGHDGQVESGGGNKGGREWRPGGWMGAVPVVILG